MEWLALPCIEEPSSGGHRPSVGGLAWRRGYLRGGRAVGEQLAGLEHDIAPVPGRSRVMPERRRGRERAPLRPGERQHATAARHQEAKRVRTVLGEVGSLEVGGRFGDYLTVHDYRYHHRLPRCGHAPAPAERVAAADPLKPTLVGE
jgi:hypothetical protein